MWLKKISGNVLVKKTSDTIAATEKVVSDVEKVIAPHRSHAFRRYPFLFTLLTAFGVAAVFYGFERIIGKIPFLFERPFLILLLGVLALFVTGKLFKKLS